MNFVIVRSDGVMTIDNAALAMDVSSLPSNIEVVAWRGNSGIIEYNDRPRVLTLFTDPSPYQSLVNAWMTAQAAASPALTLAQAKAIKSDFVDGIFAGKRIAPVAYAGFYWDASDESVLAMLQSLAVGTLGAVEDSSGGIVGEVNTALGQIIGQVNTALGRADTAFATVASRVNAALGTLAYQGNVAIATVVSNANGAFSGTASDINGSIVARYSAANVNAAADRANSYGISWAYGGRDATGGLTDFTVTLANPKAIASISNPEMTSLAARSFDGASMAGTSIAGPDGVGSVNPSAGTISTVGSAITVNWIPLGYTSPVALSLDQFSGLVSTISARRGGLHYVRLIKKAAIAALTQVSDVVSYDATVGWPA